MKRAAFLAVMLAGCFDSHAPVCTVDCASDSDCPSDLTCGPSNKCTENGAACTDSACTAGETRCGIADPQTVERCSDSGAWATTTTCDTTCLEQGTAGPHCGVVEPSFAALRDICDTPAADALRELVATDIIDTGDPGSCDLELTQSAGGRKICVIRAGTIHVSAGATVNLRGPALAAFVGDDDVVIEGDIDAAARIQMNGPGASLGPTSGEAPVGNFGGGGAGFRTAGGNGGAGSPGGGKLAGAAAPDPTGSLILQSGFRASTAPGGSSGGGGGGGLVIVSCKGAVKITGKIDAGGGGGQGGGDFGAGVLSAAGGGSGGVIAIQAMQIAITNGGLYANGGAGGGGQAVSNVLGNSGDNANQNAALCAQGGTPLGNAGRGGNGACGTKLPDPGGADSTARSGGGGGGSSGYSILYTPTGTAPVLSSPAVSSPPITTATIKLR